MIKKVVWTLVQLVISIGILFSANAQSATGGLPEDPASLDALLKQKPNHLPAREKLGKYYLRKKDYRKVIEVLAPYNNEISETALVHLADAYGQLGDTENEIRMLETYEQRQPKRFRPHHLLGIALQKAKKPDEAVEQLRQAIRYAPKHRPSYDEMLKIFTEQKANYEARQLLNDMLRLFGEKSELQSALCRLYAVDGFLVEAVRVCKAAIRTNPKVPENHIYLAQAYYDQENNTAAERIFRTAARQFPDSEFVQYAAGTYYYTEKNFPTAVRYLEQAVKINPKALRSQLQLAQALHETLNDKRALEHFVTACKLDPTKESWLEMSNAGSRVRRRGNTEIANEYDRKAATCR